MLRAWGKLTARYSVLLVSLLFDKLNQAITNLFACLTPYHIPSPVLSVLSTCFLHLNLTLLA